MAENSARLVKLLTALNKIGARINRLGLDGDLSAALQLIADNAVEAVAISVKPDLPSPQASAVIWVYDAATQTFDTSRRVAAGEPTGASTEDHPRPDGLGRQAIRRNEPVLSYREVGRSIHPAKQAVGARSMVCYPLTASNETVGLLYVYRCDEQCFDEITLSVLGNFVQLASMAIYYGRRVGGLTRTLERRVKELEKLRWATRLISTRTSLENALREILAMGLDMTAAQYGSVELYDKARRRLSIAALTGYKSELKDRHPLPVNEQSIIGWVAQHKESLLVGDLLDPRWQGMYQPLTADQVMRSELAVPLIGAGEILEGVLNIESPRPYAFTQADQGLLEMLAGEAVATLQEFRLLEAMETVARASLRSEENELLELIIQQACTLINVQVGSIWTLSDDQVWLILRQSTKGYQWDEKIPLKRSVTDQALRLRRPVTIEDVQTYPQFHNRDMAVRQGWVSGIVVPLLTPGEPRQPLGGFTLYTTRPRDFSDLDRKLLTYLANQAAIAIQNAKEVAELRRPSSLSEREHEVLTLLIDGLTNKQIADELVVSVNTVKKHVQSIFTKLNVDSRAAAVARALGSD